VIRDYERVFEGPPDPGSSSTADALGDELPEGERCID
jgi:hypothetical protein